MGAGGCLVVGVKVGEAKVCYVSEGKIPGARTGGVQGVWVPVEEDVDCNVGYGDGPVVRGRWGWSESRGPS